MKDFHKINKGDFDKLFSFANKLEYEKNMATKRERDRILRIIDKVYDASWVKPLTFKNDLKTAIRRKKNGNT